MNLLSILTPTQAKFLLDSGSTSLNTLLKTTFANLLVQQVLEVYKKPTVKPYKRRTRIINTYYVKTGKNYRTHRAKVHELAFLQPFEKSPILKIKFQHFVQIVFREAYSTTNYKDNLLKDMVLKPYFIQSFFYRYFNYYPLNSKGTKASYSLNKHINELEKQINSTLKSNPKKALKQLYKLGGHIMLLSNLDKKLIKNINPSVLKSFEWDTDKKQPLFISETPYIQGSETCFDHSINSIFDSSEHFYSEGVSLGHSYSEGGGISTDSTSTCGSSCGGGCGGGCGS